MKKRAKTDTVHISTRIREPMRARLAAAAARNKVSLNNELTRRVEQSFAKEDALEDALGGPSVSPIVAHMIVAFRTAGERMGREKGLAEWVRDPECYLTALDSLEDALLAAAPRGITDEQAVRQIEALKGKLMARILRRKELRQ